MAKPDPVELTLRGVYEANVKALRERKLGALVGKDKCRYNYGDGCGCAIGVALPEDQLAKWPKKLFRKNPRAIAVKETYTQAAVLNLLIEHQLITVLDDRAALLAKLQCGHDSWICSGDRTNYDAAMRKIAETLGETYNEA